MIDCYLGLGANLGDALGALQGAHRALIQHSSVDLIAASAIYRSAPVGPDGQNDYLNGAIGIRTHLEAEKLLDLIQDLELRAGRERKEHWGPRTLDVDLLLYGSEIIDTPRLLVPHAHVYERNFVLLPLADLLPESWSFPDGSALRDRLASAPENRIERTDLQWVEESEPGRMSA